MHLANRNWTEFLSLCKRGKKLSKTVFIIGAVWVEPKSSAAGSRMLQLISFFKNEGYRICFGTTAQRTPNSLDLKSLDVETFTLELNHPSFDALIQKVHPQIVIFDRFMTEEQFGWRVAKYCPDALRILDTEDLHCLRKTREKKYKAKEEFDLNDLLVEDITKREIAAIYRSDLTLIISNYEIQVLETLFQIDANLLLYLPFVLDSTSVVQDFEFSERKNFVSIGNFLHLPNLESVIRLKKELWPKIRRQLPEAELHVYGAYPTKQVKDFHQPTERFIVNGFVEDVATVLQKARVLLAPLSFGAGLKGKFIDAMYNACPSVTTSIGIEGYSNPEDWCGLVADDSLDFVKSAVELYSHEKIWKESQQKGVQILQQFEAWQHLKRFSKTLENLLSDLPMHRKKNFLGSMLQHQTLNSSKYMSKWIEEKNRKT